MTIPYYEEPMDDNQELFFCENNPDQTFGLEQTTIIEGELCCSYCLSHSDDDGNIYGIHKVEKNLGGVDW